MAALPVSSQCQMTGIILDTGTEAGFLHHFHIKIRPLRDSLCLQKLIFTLKNTPPVLPFPFQYCFGASLILS